MIEVAASGVHGLGAFALRELDAGERLGEYAGRRYTPSQARRRRWDAALTYVFALEDGSVIDAAQGGNATRHLNHSCEPNCIAYEELLVTGRRGIAFYTLRAIRAGEELTLDYSLVVDEAEEPETFACACGTPSCRGSMLAAQTAEL
jgi:SET domain-containing protein